VYFIILKIFSLSAKALLILTSKLKPRGSAIATGLHKLLLKTAAHVFECLRLRPAPNLMMSLMQ